MLAYEDAYRTKVSAIRLCPCGHIDTDENGVQCLGWGREAGLCMRDQRFENGGSYLMQRPANAYEEKRTLFSHMEPMSGDGRPLYSEKKPPSLTDFDSI